MATSSANHIFLMLMVAEGVKKEKGINTLKQQQQQQQQQQPQQQQQT